MSAIVPETPREPASRARLALWLGVTAVVALWQGSGFVRSLRPARYQIVDFFQEWASARNLLHGHPLYQRQELALKRYLDLERPPGSYFNEISSRPPSAVLLAVPLALLDYPDALLVWNLISLAALALTLGMLTRQLDLRVGLETLLPLTTLLLLCSPFRQHINQGQPNLVLLALMVGCWSAWRSGWPKLAGALLGLATVLKLFPAFLLVFFVVRRQWPVVTGCLLAALILTGGTVLVVGLESYQSYWVDALGYLAPLRNLWWNYSLAGQAGRFFNPIRFLQEDIAPLWRSPELADWSARLAGLLVTALVAGVAWRARGVEAEDRALALGFVGMLLVSPVCWDHYFVFLLFPLAVSPLVPRKTQDAASPSSWLLRALLCVCLVVLWFPPRLWVRIFLGIPPAETVRLHTTPLETATVLSLPSYALLGIFVLQLATQLPSFSRASSLR
jgi:uncharacterized membrane protein